MLQMARSLSSWHRRAYGWGERPLTGPCDYTRHCPDGRPLAPWERANFLPWRDIAVGYRRHYGFSSDLILGWGSGADDNTGLLATVGKRAGETSQTTEIQRLACLRGPG